MSGSGAARATDLWLRRIGVQEPLSADERCAVENALSRKDSFEPGDTLVREGTSEPFALLIISGIAARARETPKGERQILSILLPGDFCSCGLGMILPIDYDLVALSQCDAARISATQIHNLQTANAGLMLRLMRTVAEEAAVTREWVTGLGTCSGRARTAHLLCELVWRLKAVGMASGKSCILRLRQADIADAVGLSNVQVNRLLKDFERLGLIKIARGSLSILDAKGLEETSDFDASYLTPRTTQVSSLAWSGLHLKSQ